MKKPKPETRNPRWANRRTGEAGKRRVGDGARAVSSARRLAVSIVIASLLSPLLALAADYSIDWSTIDGGGGTSTGGAYSVTGTIGQPDAGGPMSGGSFSLTGGFWTLPTAVQSSNAPALLIGLAAPGFATVSWSPATPGFVLQVSDTLTPSAWTNALSGATNPVTIPAILPARFYRLNRP